MSMFLSKALAFALGAGLIFSVTSVEAAQRTTRLVQQRNQHVANYCGSNPTAPSCNDWRRNRSSWGDNDYRDLYRSNRHRREFNSNDAANMFFFSIGSAISNQPYVRRGSSHVRMCQARYRSYQVRTDSYMGYDGSWHRCNF
jgi:hypothetical protein